MSNAMPAKSSSSFLSAIVLLAALSSADAAPPERRPSRRRSSVTCAACHGPEGRVADGGLAVACRPAGHLPQYQLVFMRDGEREAGVMKEMVKNLTDDNIRDLGA